MSEQKTAILWVNNDFRLNDNEALNLACRFDQIVPVFFWDDNQSLPTGGASKWWLHHAMISFSKDLKAYGSDLLALRGQAHNTLIDLARLYKAETIIWNRAYNPNNANQVKILIDKARDQKIKTIACKGNLLCEKDFLLKSDGSPYKVYSAFWRNFINKYETRCLEKPQSIPPLPSGAMELSVPIGQLQLLPKLNWDREFYDHWQVGETHALEVVHSFLNEGVKSYNELRDRPDLSATSKLSPHLHFGEIHPQRILFMLAKKFGPLSQLSDQNINQYAKELLWREFSYHLLLHFPYTSRKPLNPAFEAFPYHFDKALFKAWKTGQTGYPIVDAGMRQLWRTGWMHNRVRMITASFLVKHLGINWTKGAAWFWDTLLDADLASNTQGWQWTAGCGADAAPFFRIFNPITQGEKFDPEGKYISQWCPELKKIPAKWIYRPWLAPKTELVKAGVKLGEDYPFPIVDHKEARERALANYETIRGRQR